MERLEVLEVSAHADRVLAWLNDGLVLDLHDPAPAHPGGVGLLTHADTVAVFDDFHIQGREGRIVRAARGRAATPARLAVQVVRIVTVDSDFKTPRSSFKPGSRLFWQVEVADEAQKPVAGATVECELVREGGQAVGSDKAMSGTDGRALFSRVLPPDAALGTCEIHVRAIVQPAPSSAQYAPSADLPSAARFEVWRE